MGKQTISNIWNGYCPESLLKGKTVRMRLNQSDLFESEETGLQICVLSGAQAIVMNHRGKGKFRTTPDYADEIENGEFLSPQNTDRAPFNEPTVAFSGSSEIEEYIKNLEPMRVSNKTPSNMIHFKTVPYEELNAKQKENYNFQKVSGILADFGYTTLRLSDDWQGADFIAQPKDGLTFLKVQLKGRLTFATKYRNKEIYICFRENENWYLVDHDSVLEIALEKTNIKNTDSWITGQTYSFPTIPKELLDEVSKYKIE